MPHGLPDLARDSEHPLEQYDVVETFAGPGGASLGIRNLGLHGLGIEWDDAACATRRAAGLPTLQADVSKVDPREYRGIEGKWDSPPCQGFSRAGLQKGHGDAGRILAHIEMVTDELEWVPFSDDGMTWADPRSQFVLEPLRWALLMEPRWMVWEQVPFVQLIWDACKPVLEEWGYEVWTGKLRAEQYGVPQTRERAMLIASRDGVVGCPPVTHSKFYSRDPQRLDEGVLPWVSMAEALGWTGNVGFPRRNDKDDGGQYRARDFHDAGRPSPVVTEKARSWVRTSYGKPVEDGRNGTHVLDPHERPAHTVTTKTGSWEVVQAKQMGAGMVERHGDRPPRRADQPSFTITSAEGGGSARLRWEERPLVVSTGNNSATVGPAQREGRRGEKAPGQWRKESKPYERSIDVPAPTVDGKAPGAWQVHAPGGRRQQERVRGKGLAEKQGPVRPRDVSEPSFTITAGGSGATNLQWTSGKERVTENVAIRAWAAEQGIELSVRGRIPETVRQRWFAEVQPEPVALQNNTSANSSVRELDEPAPTMYFGARLNSMYWLTSMGDVRSKNGTVRTVDQPAGTLTSSMDNGNYQWVRANEYEALMGVLAGEVTLLVEERSEMLTAGLNNTAGQVPRAPGESPSATVTGKGSMYWRIHWREWTPEGLRRVRDQSGSAWDHDWPLKRPATVLATRDLVAHPGENANRFNGSKKSRNDGLRVSVEEAGILQSFPADYPWQGTRTKQFEQVGNAVPPLLASHAALEAARPTRGSGWASLPDGTPTLNYRGVGPTHYDPRQTGNPLRPTDAPAPTMLAAGLAKGVGVWRESTDGGVTYPDSRRRRKTA